MDGSYHGSEVATVCPNKHREEDVRAVYLFHTVINVLHFDGSATSETCRSLISVKILL